jgi:hypothetical protein
LCIDPSPEGREGKECRTSVFIIPSRIKSPDGRVGKESRTRIATGMKERDLGRCDGLPPSAAYPLYYKRFDPFLTAD